MTVENQKDEKDVQFEILEEMKTLEMPEMPSKVLSLFGNIIVGGLPCVSQDKIDKLKGFLLKNMQCSLGNVINIELPVDGNGLTKGCAFIQFESHDAAIEMVRSFNGRQFDKTHTYQVMLLDEYQKTLDVKDNFEEPPHSEFKFKDTMLSWLLQEQCHDQIMFNFKSSLINICEHTNSTLIDIISRDRFTESKAMWSTSGTYLASMHEKGVALWGGKSFEQITKYSHRKVQHLSFSPRENYLVTTSLVNDNFHVIVWNVILEIEIRQFVIANDAHYGSRLLPQLRWSFDDKYFARTQGDKISIYEAATCVLLDKKSIDMVGVRDLMWSSNSHVISFWVPETVNAPAKVVLMEIPSKEEIFTKNLFNVTDINLYWSHQDEFLAVVGDRYTKKKKVIDESLKFIGLNSNLEIFRIQEKGIPVDKIDIKEKGQVVDFQWEPSGTKFAIIIASQTITNLQIFDVKDAAQIQEIKSIEYNTPKMTMIRWSPKGQHLVVAALKIGIIEFIDGSDGTVFHKCEHGNLYDLCWDPTGRYIVTYTLSLVSDTNECIVNFWNIAGKLLYSKNFPGLKQLLWRPRPPCLVTEKNIKELKKGMGKYANKFVREDEIMTNETKRNLIEGRRNSMANWIELRTMLSKLFLAERECRVQLRGGRDTDNVEGGHEEQFIYVLVSTTTTVC